MPDLRPRFREPGRFERLLRESTADQRPREFGRIGVFRGAALCTSGQGVPARKTLVIEFSGRQNRLMLPAAMMLDCLAPDLYDLVALRG